MSRQIVQSFLLAASILAISACSSDDAGDDNTAQQAPEKIGNPAVDDKAMLKAEREAAIAAAEDGRIDCALGNSEEYARVCTVERISGNDGQILVVRHPDGGFRRFRVLTDGRGLEPAEGFDETSLKILDDQMIEVISGGDAYRLPAQIKSAPKPAQDAEPANPEG